MSDSNTLADMLAIIAGKKFGITEAVVDIDHSRWAHEMNHDDLRIDVKGDPDEDGFGPWGFYRTYWGGEAVALLNELLGTSVR